MGSTYHTAHNARILTIYPKTLRIRCFALYNFIRLYHNTPVYLDLDNLPDSNALRYH